jgi:hypothetical protein
VKVKGERLVARQRFWRYPLPSTKSTLSTTSTEAFYGAQKCAPHQFGAAESNQVKPNHQVNLKTSEQTATEKADDDGPEYRWFY